MVAAVLDRPTLVLNRNWQPVGVATVAKALTKVWNESARIVDPADYQQYTWEDWSQLRYRKYILNKHVIKCKRLNTVN